MHLIFGLTFLRVCCPLLVYIHFDAVVLVVVPATRRWRGRSFSEYSLNIWLLLRMHSQSSGSPADNMDVKLYANIWDIIIFFHCWCPAYWSNHHGCEISFRRLLEGEIYVFISFYFICFLKIKFMERWCKQKVKKGEGLKGWRRVKKLFSRNFGQ